MRRCPARAASILAAACLFIAWPAAAACPFVAPPIRCTTLEAPLDTAVVGPLPSGGIDLVYLYAPSCRHCAALESEFTSWAERLPANVTVRRQVVAWSMPAKPTMHDARVADAMLEALGASAAVQREFVHLVWRRWHEREIEAFFTRLGLSPAQAEQHARSEPTQAVLRRRVALAKATRATQVPYIVVARRHAVTVDFDSERDTWKPERVVGVLEQLLAAQGVKMLPAAAIELTATTDAATPADPPAAPATSPPGAYVPRPMPMPADFLPAPANAAAAGPRQCASREVRTQPKDLREKDEMARRMLTQLRMWGEKHFRFEGCTDYGFIISQWQSMVGLPETGVLDAVVVKSVLDAVTTIQPKLLAAHRQWSEARVAARDAGLDPNTGRPPTADELKRRRENELARGARSAPPSPAAFVRPAPVGPPETQVFGFSLGQPFAPQLPLCPWRSGWDSGLDFSATCQHRMKRLGWNSTNWLTPFEAEIFQEAVRDAAEVAPESDGLVAISFADDERPGLLARAGIRGLLVAGRLEGIGFVPGDRDAVLEAFTSRFGPPVPMPVSMQNEKGATWTGRRYEFRRNDVSATLNCVEFGTNRCSFAEVLTTRGRSALEEWRARDARRGVQF